MLPLEYIVSCDKSERNRASQQVEKPLLSLSSCVGGYLLRRTEKMVLFTQAFPFPFVSRFIMQNHSNMTAHRGKQKASYFAWARIFSALLHLDKKHKQFSQSEITKYTTTSWISYY